MSGKAAHIPRSLSGTVSVFSFSAALFEKLRKDKSGRKANISLDAGNNNDGVLNRLKSAYSRAPSLRNPVHVVSAEGNSLGNLNKEVAGSSLRLSSRQIILVLSSIWAQSISPENTPENYEAIAHTYSLVLLFSRAKSSSQEALVRSFQLSFSLRGISLAEGGPLPPSRCRSLFTLATAMIIFSAKAYEIHSLVSCAKATLNNKLAEMCTVKEQLLSEFLPDDVCPLGAQMFENPSKIYELDSRQSVCQDETIPFFNIDDDSMTDNKPKPELLLTAENATFLSVNQLLESVVDTAQQVGRYSVSTAPDLPYKEMASHCEALLMGKQQKMSNLMTAQRQDYLISLCVENDELEQKKPTPVTGRKSFPR